ncbi:unnamed protein product [Macrosiphum euphorbiae]|uniref:Uncharacterized protein n=1 Tax=Macrosiphum euphorbiae TaxID=13131 RepID=A0AAV0XWW5_9HEMI|nr:unnamed protein product [Macrosiphum euphorbiae]
MLKRHDVNDYDDDYDDKRKEAMSQIDIPSRLSPVLPHSNDDFVVVVDPSERLSNDDKLRNENEKNNKIVECTSSSPGHRSSTSSQHVDRVNSSSAVANTNRYTNVFDGKGSSSVSLRRRRLLLRSDNITKAISFKSCGTKRRLRENSITLSSSLSWPNHVKTFFV